MSLKRGLPLTPIFESPTGPILRFGAGNGNSTWRYICTDTQADEVAYRLPNF